MKVVDAKWELRNLGVKTIEISIEKKDLMLSETDLLATIEKHRLQYDAKYVVIKADTRYPEISLYLQGAGFILMENQINLRGTRKDISNVLEKYRSVCVGADYRPADKDDIKRVFSEMERNIFVTDRISLDPHFGINVANRRYSLWMKDELERGATIQIYLFEGKPIGFSLDKVKADGKTVVGLLGGLFNRPETRYLGSMYIYAGVMSFCKSDLRFLRTAVSSNNLNILQLHLMFGREITDIKNVLIKHFD